MGGFLKVAIPVAATVAAIALAPETGGASIAADSATAAATEGASYVGMSAADQVAADVAESTPWYSGVTDALSGAGSYIRPIAGIAAVGGQLAGTAIAAEGEQQQAAAARANAQFVANQDQANANSEMAAAEQNVAQQNIETNVVLSNARAASSADGGSSTDPTAMTNLKTIAGQGRYRALTDMYNGESEAQASETAAQAALYGGAVSAQASNTNTYTTILNGASSLYDKYGNPFVNKYTSYNN